MSDYKTCNYCKGSTKSAPLGFILKECVYCEGIGYRPITLDSVNNVQLASADSVKVISSDQKKRGRPKSK